jgi:hypothetical protein
MDVKSLEWNAAAGTLVVKLVGESAVVVGFVAHGQAFESMCSTFLCDWIGSSFVGRGC